MCTSCSPEDHDTQVCVNTEVNSGTIMPSPHHSLLVLYTYFQMGNILQYIYQKMLPDRTCLDTGTKYQK